MSSISTMEARLPPGFRFHPRDDELVLDYLCRKLSSEGEGGAYGGIAMVDVDLNKREPWELPDEACVGGRDWYFFSLHDRKYATGQRTNRATRSGYWKATGKDRPISARRRAGAGGTVDVVGMRKTLVFYQGRAPRGSKTEWVMHEFRVEGAAVADAVVAGSASPLKEDWVLCRVFYRTSAVTTRPAAAAADVVEAAGSLSNDLMINLPMPMPRMPPVDAAYLLAYDHVPAATLGGNYYYQPDDDADGLPAGQVNKSLSSFKELLTSMVERDVVDGAVAKSELRQDWTEAAYAQQSAVSSSSQAWNPFLSSG